MQNSSSVKTILVTGLALFAMFFGAGNLIYPVMIGYQSGTNQPLVTLGFLVTGVLLPMLGMIAAATSSSGILGIAERISHYPGMIFCWLMFLSTGVLYGLPRTATVSYSMSIGWALGDKNKWILFAYVGVFFLITLFFALNPNKILDKIGGWLTPILLTLLVILIIASYFVIPYQATAPVENYQTVPVIRGLLDGYSTLDALASFVFGVVIISTLRNHGFTPGRKLFQGTALAGLIAAFCLGIVYTGLSMFGSHLQSINNKITNGGEGLAVGTHYVFGAAGIYILAAIAILACLTTSVGLTGASTQFFSGLFPQIKRQYWVIIHVVLATGVANLGLDALLKMVIPIMFLCYPITIALVIVCLLDIIIPGHLYWSYRLSVWIAALFGLFDAIKQAGYLQETIELIPLAKYSLAWVVPVFLMLVLGLIIDYFQGRFKRNLDYDRVAWERNRSLMESGLGGNYQV